MQDYTHPLLMPDRKHALHNDDVKTLSCVILGNNEPGNLSKRHLLFKQSICVQSRFVTYCVELIIWLPIINSYHIEVVSTINSLK